MNITRESLQALLEARLLALCVYAGELSRRGNRNGAETVAVAICEIQALVEYLNLEVKLPVKLSVPSPAVLAAYPELPGLLEKS